MTTEEINKMSYEEMLRLRRFAPIGHPAFISGTPLSDAFEKRFNHLLATTPAFERSAASKRIGWNRD